METTRPAAPLQFASDSERQEALAFAAAARTAPRAGHSVTTTDRETGFPLHVIESDSPIYLDRPSNLPVVYSLILDGYTLWSASALYVAGPAPATVFIDA